MTKLPELRSQLSKLHRWRRTVRLGTAWCSVALAVLLCLAGLFVIDWTLEMTRLQRLVALAVSAGIVYWAYHRFARPWLAREETLLDVALLVERQQKIDSDLVAALQFETPQAARWGSAQLEEAVVEYVADFSKGMDLLEGFNREQMTKRAAATIAAAAVLCLAALIFPRHAGTFISRMFFSSAHYPTNTQIDTVHINGQLVNLTPGYEESAKCAYGNRLVFQVICDGELPDEGRAVLRTKGGLTNEVALKRVLLAGTGVAGPGGVGADGGVASASHVKLVGTEENTSEENIANRSAAAGNAAVGNAAGERTATYVGELSRLVDSLDYQLYFGDAWTETAQIHVIPLPKIEFTLKPTPPKYAQGATEAVAESSARQFAVIEGSRVDLEVTSDKPLEYARLIIEDKTYPLVAQEKSADEKLHRFRLETKQTPLASVMKPVAYRIEAQDEDGLQPAQPIQGFIRLRSDRGPRIFGNLATKQVLPSAKPPIVYNATDDFGISAIRLHVQVMRKGTEVSTEKVLDIRRPGKPVLREKLPLEGKYALDLSPFKLVKGDQVTLTPEAIDFRGRREGQSAMGEPLVLFVTDQSGIYADLSEMDERAARQLDATIRLYLGDKP